MPTFPALHELVVEVLKDVSRRPIEPKLDDDLVSDLGFDSLQIMEVVAELENRLDITISLDEVAGTRTVAQIVTRVAALAERGRES